MEPQPILIDGQQRLIALRSIIDNRDAVAWRLNNEGKSLDEYKKQYEDQREKCDKLIEELTILEQLIAAFGGKAPEHNELPLAQTVDLRKDSLPDEEDKKGTEGEFVASYKRVQYPSSPKEKLKELVLSGSYFKTDDELHSDLQREFNIPEIPKKTVVNYLSELKVEGVISRFKSKKLNAYINGSPAWLDSSGLPLKPFIVP